MNNISLPGSMRPDGAMPLGPAPAAPSEGRRLPTLAQYWRAAYRWRWAMLGVIAVAVAVGIAATLLTTPQYEAVVTIEISREESRVVNIETVEPRSNAVDQEFYETQYGLLRSRSLAESVARDLNLVTDSRFFEMYGVELSGAAARGNALSSAARNERLRIATNILLDHVQVKPARLSRLVQIRFSSPDNLFAARVANQWAENFIRSNLQRRFEAASYARSFLEDRLNDTRAKLEESERRLVTYAGNQGIINLGPETDDQGQSTGARSLISDDASRINAALAEATADRVRAESQWQLAQSGGTSAQSIANPTISNLRQRRAEVAGEYARLLAQFDPDYPQAQALKSQLETLDRSIEQELGRTRQAINLQYREAVDRENALRARVNELKSGLLDLRRRSIQYNIYQRDVDTNRELYEGLLQRYKEIGVAGGIGTNNVSVVDPAEPPRAPARPRPFVNLLISLLAGLALAVVLAAVLEQIDEGVTDPAELERLVGVPLLGSSPLVRGDVLEELKDPKSEIFEAYMSVRTSLSFSTDHGLPRTLMVTSTRPAEGKTTSTIALAVALSRLGRRVLLIDADMRSPSLHGLLGLSKESGFSSVLSGNAEFGETLQEMGELMVMAAGPHPPNAAELLAGSRLKKFLDEAIRQFDHVLLDSPPVMGLADAPLIASAVEATVFVIQSHGTKARFANVAIERLRQSQANLLGAILTKYDARSAPTGYGYDYGYGYGRPDAPSRAPAKASSEPELL